MPEDQVNQTGDQGAPQPQPPTDSQSLGWRAGLPDPLKNHEALTPHKTVGDLGKVHIEALGKLKELEGKTAQLEGSLKNAIPKLPENATKEQVEAFYSAIGRPNKPEEYEFPKDANDPEHSPEMVSWAQKTFYEVGLTRNQGAVLAKQWGAFVKGMVEAEEAESERMKAENEKAFRGEFKTEDEYKSAHELTKRFWNKITGTDFDKAFEEAESWQVPLFRKFIFTVAKATGEDWSPQGAQTGGASKEYEGMIYSKTPQHQRK